MPIIPNDNMLLQTDVTNADLCLLRNNMDKIVNGHGHKLLRLVKMSSLLILNGRSESDKSGKFTFCNHRGSSTIDYAIMSREILPSYNDFKVLSFTPFSDHAPINLSMKLSSLLLPPNEVPHVKPVPQWKKSYEMQFKEYLESEETLNDLSLMTEALDNDDMSTTEAEHFLERFCQHLYTAGRNHSRYPRFGNGPRPCNKKSNDWFDADCYALRETFKEHERQFRVNNTDQCRLDMCRARDAYRKRCRLNVKRKLRVEATELTNISKKDSRTFWKKIKKSDKSINGNCDFTEYKKKLGSQMSPMTATKDDLVSNWEQADEDSTLFYVDELDRDITIAELNTCIKSLKITSHLVVTES